MSSEPGPKTPTLGVSIADNITLRSATIVAVCSQQTTAWVSPCEDIGLLKGQF